MAERGRRGDEVMPSFHEFGIAVGDMERDFPVVVDVEGRKRRRRADIAIFAADEPHVAESLRRVVVCKPELDNDLPLIAERHREFRSRDPETGARRPGRR